MNEHELPTDLREIEQDLLARPRAIAPASLRSKVLSDVAQQQLRRDLNRRWLRKVNSLAAAAASVCFLVNFVSPAVRLPRESTPAIEAASKSIDQLESMGISRDDAERALLMTYADRRLPRLPRLVRPAATAAERSDI